MRRALLLAFIAANLLCALVVVFQMATEPEPKRLKAPETGGYYELFSGDYVPSDEELGIGFPESE